MRGEFERRLRRLEAAYAKSNTIELWIEQDDGRLRCQSSGEYMRHEAFYKLYPPGSSGIYIMNRTDAKL
jgi:hypothetical protein